MEEEILMHLLDEEIQYYPLSAFVKHNNELYFAYEYVEDTLSIEESDGLYLMFKVSLEEANNYLSGGISSRNLMLNSARNFKPFLYKIDTSEIKDIEMCKAILHITPYNVSHTYSVRINDDYSLTDPTYKHHCIL